MNPAPSKPAWKGLEDAGAMAEENSENIFGRIARRVDSFFNAKFLKIGSFIGRRPGVSIAMSLLLVVVCGAGFSQMKSESRGDKLWIPQGTRAQQDEAKYTVHFPPLVRVNDMLLEAKASDSGGALTKEFLAAAIDLHVKIEALSFKGDNLTTLCVMSPADGHPCLIQSILGAWRYSPSVLQADADPIATLNNQNMGRADMERFLGGAKFDSNGRLTDAKALRVSYFVQSNREMTGGDYEDPRGEGWEKKFLELLKCDAPKCTDGKCVCDYASSQFAVYPQAWRSFSDEFGDVVRGDVGLINSAFLIMIVYLVINLGGLGHKIKSRALLAFGSVIAIVLGGAAGYGLSMWFQFKYTPVHSVLPFVVLGIGVDDSFVIMNALDRTDPNLPVPERIAKAISHAGVSIMVTSLTDFVALMISVSSALPALSSFCMYASLAVLFLFVLQITLFTALATFDAHRVRSGRIDCCFCLPKGCPCCPTAPVAEAGDAAERGGPDPNQMCCAPPKHQGGLVGKFLQHMFGPVIVKPIVAMVVIFVFLAFCGVCSWQASDLAVEDTQQSFIPDNSYIKQTTAKNDMYFAKLGSTVYLMTGSGDYYASQTALSGIGSRIGGMDSVQPITSETFKSWAKAFQEACAAGTVTGVTHNNGVVTVQSQYYSALKTWLNGPGRQYSGEVIWADPADAQQGIKASRMMFELQPMKTVIGGRTVIDAGKAVRVMDDLRAKADGWSDIPGGAIMYSWQFLSWESFRIIKREMFLSVGLCLVAVFVITLLLIAHPLTAGLVFLCVLMTIVDILGCLNMIGLAIDSVSVIQLVIAVGFCVDYAAHIAHNFMMTEGSREDRVTSTLGNVGSAVLNGGVSTFLATMLLALSKSYVFRVLFYSFFLTVFLGLLHGMVLLPAILSRIGPKGYGGHGDQESPAAESKKVGVAGSDEDEKVGG